jgi:glutathione synthase/RimK-type ligase-like ATP-grasp enzyme
MSAIHVIHENDEWFAPLRQALQAANLPFASWHMGEGTLDLAETPPRGVFFNRMSASSHTRGHEHAPELTACIPAWLERHGRRVVNGSAALRLELNKIAQYQALERHGFTTPRTVAAYGREHILAAARRFDKPFITKHNRSGKGLGVRLFRTAAAFVAYLDSPAYIPPVDGILLLQEYIESPQPVITRLEFIAGRFFYAMRVDSSQGFELCPADSCAADARCAFSSGLKFEIVNETAPGTDRYETLLKQHGAEVAGVEIIRDRTGRIYTYDININTNYNAAAEAAAGIAAMDAVAAFLGRELQKYG